MTINKTIKMLRAAWNYPQTPQFIELPDGYRYYLETEDFSLSSAAEDMYGEDSYTYRLYIRNFSKTKGFPNWFSSTGLVPWMVYKTLEYRESIQGWRNIITDKPITEKQKSLMFKKIKKSSERPLISTGATKLGHPSDIQARITVDGYSIRTKQVGSKYHIYVVDKVGAEHHINDNNYAKKVFNLLKQKHEKIR